jgi:putative spermidine/putrescine transport system permease protein
MMQLIITVANGRFPKEEIAKLTSTSFRYFDSPTEEKLLTSAEEDHSPSTLGGELKVTVYRSVQRGGFQSVESNGRRYRPTRTAPALSPLLWPAAAYLILFYLFPLLRMLLLSVFDPGFTLANYSHLLKVPLYSKILVNTFEISAMVAVVTLLLSYPTAYLIARSRQRLAEKLLIFVLIPFFTSILVRNYAWIFILSDRGVINSTLLRFGLISRPLPLIFNRLGVLVGMVHILLPYMILILLTVMRGISKQIPMAAASLGASPFVAFRRVFLPLSLPGIGAGSLLVFVLALAFFVTPAMLGGLHDTMIANSIATQVGFLDWGFAGALATVLLVVSLAALCLMQWLFGGAGLIAPGLKVGDRVTRGSRVHYGKALWILDRIMDPIWPYIFPAVGGAVLVFLILPVFIMIPLSFNSAAYFIFPPPGFSWQWYKAFFNSPSWLDSTWHSFEIAAMTVVLTMAMAVPFAMGITRSRSRLALAVYGLILSPMIVPGIIIAISVFFLFSQLRLVGTIWGVALGHTIGALPIVTIVMVAALYNFDVNLERAARSLGASPLRTALRVTLPVLNTAVLTSAFLAFLHSFDELLIALFVSGIKARTLPKKMWESLQEINPTITAVSTLLIVFVTIVLCLIQVAKRGGDWHEAGRGGKA